MSAHVCVQCGDALDTREELELHWEAEGHHPDAVQRAQVEKARASLGPVESATIQRRRFNPTRIRRP